MADIDSALRKSRLFSELLRNRSDEALRKTVQDYTRRLEFHKLEDLAISPGAWAKIVESEIEPRLVFAHPNILQAHPKTSSHYRGIALLSQKQVGQLATQIAAWEDGSRKRPVTRSASVKVARLYNAVISCIIEDSTDWALEDGYRNILVTTGIRLDGMYRNRIGTLAEQLIKGRIVAWLRERTLIEKDLGAGVYQLKTGVIMRFGSEPDIEFCRDSQIVATIEIKGGTDPAGALERLGAMQKSFAETPPGCVNFLVAGVVTDEMQTRLDQIGSVKAVFRLEQLENEETEWKRFVEEVFHYGVRINGSD